jgi:hypothetical protein
LPQLSHTRTVLRAKVFISLGKVICGRCILLKRRNKSCTSNDRPFPELKKTQIRSSRLRLFQQTATTMPPISPKWLVASAGARPNS